MSIFELIISNYPQTVIAWFWISVFALGSGGMLLLVKALNINAETYGPQVRHFRSETNEFFARLEAL